MPCELGTWPSFCFHSVCRIFIYIKAHWSYVGWQAIWETSVPSVCSFVQESLEMSPHPGLFSAELWNSQIFMLDRRLTDCRAGDYFSFIAYSQMEDGLVCNNCIVMNSTSGICSKKKERKKEKSKTDGGIVTAPVVNAKFVPTFKTRDLTENYVSQFEKCVCCHFWIVLRMVICSKVD